MVLLDKKEAGNQFFKQGQYAKALECYEAAIENDDQAAERAAVHCNEALCHLKLGSNAEACRKALQALGLKHGHPKALFRLASALKALHAYDACNAVCDVSISSSESAVDLKDLKGFKDDALKLQQANGASASGLDEPVNAQLKADVQQLLASLGGVQLGGEQHRASSHTQAGPASSAPADDPVERERLLGTAKYKAGDYKAAYEHYSAALAHDEGNLSVLGNRAAAALMLKRYAAAQADCERVLEADGTNVKAQLRMWKACLGLNDVQQAVKWATTASQNSDSPATARTDLAKLQKLQRELAAVHDRVQAGDSGAAMQAARRAGALFPDMTIPDVQLALAEAQLLIGSPNQALATSRAVLMHQSSSKAMDMHARALVATGNVTRALSVFQQLYREDPDNVTVAKALKRTRVLEGGKVNGNAAFKAGRYQDAHDEYSKTLTAGQDMRNTFIAQVACNRANACLKLKRARDALSDADLAIAADANFAKAYLRRAQAHEALEAWEAAVKDYTKVQELEQSMPGIADMLRHAQVELKKSKRVDYYKLLDVDKSAGDAEIKKAYKRAALKCHPDKVVSEEREEAEKRFKLLGEANAVLTDDAKRARYDAGWSNEEIEQGFQEGVGPRGFHGGGGGGGMPPGMEDMLFSMMFGGGGGGRGGGMRGGFPM